MTSGAPTSDFASANDTGPVSVIIEDPSCAPWFPINDTWAAVAAGGWTQRDPSIPADTWGPELRGQYEAVRSALKAAADQTVPLARLTNHRVMRELYAQFVSYARAYTDRIPSYSPSDNSLVLTAVAAGEVLSNICQAVSYGSAAARGPLVPATQEPSQAPDLNRADEPVRFLERTNPTCDKWQSTVEKYDNDPRIILWLKTATDSPVSQWTPEQLTTTDDAKPLMAELADHLESLGRESKNGTFEDFATLAAVYQRAFVNSLPTYTTADSHLYKVALKTPGLIQSACDAVGA